MTKMPGTPIDPLRSGPATIDAANVAPMVMPIAAMARVRTTSRVRSAVSATTAAEMAPAPCRQRPAMTQPMLAPDAATKLPMANTTRPL